MQAKSEGGAMNRQQIYDEIKELFGIVPTFFKSLPDNSLEAEWRLFRITQIDESAIPNKYKELIGLGIAAATKCRYCAYYHTEAARLNGATEAEIEDAVHYAKASAGWSAYINGLQVDYEQFKDEIQQMAKYVRETMKEKEPVTQKI